MLTTLNYEITRLTNLILPACIKLFQPTGNNDVCSFITTPWLTETNSSALASSAMAALAYIMYGPKVRAAMTLMKLRTSFGYPAITMYFGNPSAKSDRQNYVGPTTLEELVCRFDLPPGSNSISLLCYFPVAIVRHASVTI